MPLPIYDEPAKPVQPAPEKPAMQHVTEERERIHARIASIGKRVGVHSGKGGVGKTFVAANIALLLASEGHQVGLLDADIDCPNVHEFLNVHERHTIDDAGRIVPIRHPRFPNLVMASTGFLQERHEPLIVRGPIKHRILTDFLEKTAWGPLDYLVIDFPPGTSDVPLSAMQFANLDGVILITTPQKEAVADVTRAAGMARKLDVPILGLVANMEGEVFGHGGAALAKTLAVPFLGSIPLSRSIRECNDRGDVAFLESELETVAQSMLKMLGQ
jgi:ATP-binding protein involved in chromosome partitioning